MNKNGETGNLVGLLVLTAITVIVGVILLQASAQNVGTATNSQTLVNQSLPSATVNLTGQYITNCKEISGTVMFNATGNVEIPATNWSIANRVIDPSSGQLAVNVTPNASFGAGTGFNKGIWKISGTCLPLTYEDDSGGRSMLGMVVIMFAIGIAVVALVPVLKQKDIFTR